MSKELRDVYAVSCASVRQPRALGEQDLAPTVADAQFYASQFYASLGLPLKGPACARLSLEVSPPS
jgi:hypothetical protein